MVWKGGIRRGQTQKAPPAAPSTVRLGGATERYRWEAGAGGERRARSAHSHARELGKAVRSAVSFAGMPGLAGSGVAREARARGVGGEGGEAHVRGGFPPGRKVVAPTRSGAMRGWRRPSMPSPSVRQVRFVVTCTTSPHQLVVVVVKISSAVEVQPPTSARTRGGNDASHGRGLGHVTPPVELRLAGRVFVRRGGGPDEASAARPHSRPRQKARRARPSDSAGGLLSILDLTVTAGSDRAIF